MSTIAWLNMPLRQRLSMGQGWVICGQPLRVALGRLTPSQSFQWCNMLPKRRFRTNSADHFRE